MKVFLRRYKNVDELYTNVLDGPALERERLEEELRRLSVWVWRVEDGLVEEMRRGGNAGDVVAFARMFSVVAEGRKI